MIRSILIAAFSVAVAVPSFADVTIKSNVSGKGMGVSGNTVSVMYIKGNKMRTDTVTGDTTRTSIYDVDSGKMYAFDSKKKEADVFDMAKLAAEVSANVQVDDMKASIKSNGKTKDIGGKTAAGYDMEIIVPSTMGGKDGMKMTITLSGPTWIVKDAAGAKDYLAFYTNAVGKGWFFTDPKAAKGQPGQAKAMAQMSKELAEIGGISYETEMNVKMGGEGPMASMMSRMGNISMTTTVQSVETTALAADLFAPPAGYKLKEQK